MTTLLNSKPAISQPVPNPHGHCHCAIVYTRSVPHPPPSRPLPLLLFPPPPLSPSLLLLLLPCGCFPPHPLYFPLSSSSSTLFFCPSLEKNIVAKLHAILIRLSAGLRLNRYTTSPSSPLAQFVGGYQPVLAFPPPSCCSTPPTLPRSPSKMAERNRPPPLVPLGSSLMSLQSLIPVVSPFP